MEAQTDCWQCKTMRHQCHECNRAIKHPADDQAPLCADCLKDIPEETN